MERSTRSVWSGLGLLLGLLIAAALTACAGGAWKQALGEDSPAAYYRFLRDHPNSEHATQAQEHLDFLKLARAPTLVTFEAFNERYPESELADRLRPQMEPQAFELARARGTVDAYEGFLARFASGSMAARARGNAAYLNAAGFAGDPLRLAAFAQAHPESDFAQEARRSASTAAGRSREGFGRVGLSIEIGPETPDARRVRQAFLDRTRALYEGSGVELVVLPEVVEPGTEGQLPAAQLSIVHRERSVQTSISSGSVSRPGLVATTVVTLRAGPGTSPIFRREFGLRVDPLERLSGTSALFTAVAPRYWQSFFVPIASWPTDEAVRPPVALSAEGVDVDARGERAVVLHDDGSFELMELADPTAPASLVRYTRPRDLKHWSGVRILGERVAIFGEEGIELIAFGEQGPRPVARWRRDEIGTVFAIEEIDDQLVLAGARGLLLGPLAGGSVERIMRRVVRGMARVGEHLVFTDGDSVFVSNLALLARQRVEARLRLGNVFAPGRIEAFGTRAVVMGAAGVLVLDLKKPARPRVVSRLRASEVGHVVDATQMRGRIFLLGERGLQMLDARAERVEQFVDVVARGRLASMGRHLVVVGEKNLQVVDATPLLVSGATASPAAAKAPSP